MTKINTSIVYVPHPKIYFRPLKYKNKNDGIKIYEINTIIKEYGLKIKNKPTVIHGGIRNFTIILDTYDGKFVLKRYQEALGESTILQEHSILNYLKMINFPSVRLMKTKNGHTLVKKDKKRFAIFEYINKNYVSHDNLLFYLQENLYIKNAGKILAFLHKSLRTFKPCKFNPDGFDPMSGKRVRDNNWFGEKLEYCVKNTVNKRNERYKLQYKTLMDKVKTAHKILKEKTIILNNIDLQKQVIHKDYSPNHILYRPNGLPIVIDFEIARFDWRVIDIIDGFGNFCKDRKGRYSFRKMKLFYGAYQSNNLLNENECHYIVDIWKLMLVWSCIWFWHDHCKTGAKNTINIACNKLKYLEWLNSKQEFIKHYL